MTRCPEECGKQWRPKQRKAGWKKQKKEKSKEKVRGETEEIKEKTKGRK